MPHRRSLKRHSALSTFLFPFWWFHHNIIRNNFFNTFTVMHHLHHPRHSVCLWSILLLSLSAPHPTLSFDTSDLPPCYTPCENNYSGEEAVPGTDCKLYHVCFQGEIRQRVRCGEDMLFNPYTKYCDYKWLVRCDLEPTCPPTLSPSIR